MLNETIDGEGTLYLYGLDLLAQVQPDGSQNWYHADALGSTRHRTDDSGSVVVSYEYKVFGAIREQVEGEMNDFTFTGEQEDFEISHIFFRERYYDTPT